MLDEDATEYIAKLTENLHLLPSNDFTARMPSVLFQRFREDAPLAPFNCLKPVKENYDFIISDLPPALSDQTINGLVASDFVVVMFETSKFCYNPKALSSTAEQKLLG
ncbi:MAG: hypothetical protein CW346_16245 [Bacillaceae bacterium]|nr:hypothetical protein [Bacillaceae bacterium]